MEDSRSIIIANTTDMQATPMIDPGDLVFSGRLRDTHYCYSAVTDTDDRFWHRSTLVEFYNPPEV